MIPTAALAALLAFPQTSIVPYTQGALKDVMFVADVKIGRQAELRKIGKDFGIAYAADNVTVQLKDTFKVRTEMNYQDTKVVYVINGGRKAFQVPRLPRQTEDVADAPGKQQNVFDFGLVTPALFTNFFDAKFVRNDRASGDVVFDLTYDKGRYQDTTRYRVWIDPDKKFVTKKEWFGQDGNLRATFLFEAPTQIGGVWVPTRATVMNAEGKLAGQLNYTKFKVNTNLPESLFKV